MSNAEKYLEKMRQKGKTSIMVPAPPPGIAEPCVVSVAPQPITVSASRPIPPVKAACAEQPKKAKKKPHRQEKFRLPDGAAFLGFYDASREKWVVSMAIGEETSTMECGSIHHAIMKLGQSWYRMEQERAREVVPTNPHSDLPMGEA